MNTPTVTDYLKFANLQMAAEAFIRDEKTKQLASDGELLINALVEGNKHASRFTSPPTRRKSLPTAGPSARLPT